jgi:ribulose-phosphate 3-epimerase
MEIIPSIIAENAEEVRTRIARVEGLVKWVELDVADGVFVPSFTWPMMLGQAPDDLKAVEGKTKLSAHLMVEHPETIVEDWLDFTDRLIVHYESTDELAKIIENYSLPRGSEATLRGLGIALELHTPVEKVYEYLDRVKLVQLMSIERVGYAGEKFDERVFEKIKALKTNWPDVQIIVDGGIDLEIGARLAEAGVNGLVVGSRIWQSKNIEETIKEFQNL